jgi:hypothetical protein
MKIRRYKWAAPFFMALFACFISGCEQPRGTGGGQPVEEVAIPGIPQNIELLPDDGTIIVSWDVVTGADGYEAWYGRTLNIEKAEKWEGQTTVSFDRAGAVITNLENGKLYYVCVRAYNDAGHSEYSEWGYKRPAKPAYSVPSLFFDYGKMILSTETPVTGTYTVPSGRTLVLAPVEWRLDSDGYEWTVDGTVQAEVGKTFSFTPSAEGNSYVITVKAKKDGEDISGAEAETYVLCTAPEGTYRRDIETGSQAKADIALDFAQAPGQFVSSQYITIAKNLELANTTVHNSNSPDYCFSLGGFGGYVVYGFDHSVMNTDVRPDLLVNGNAFGGWTEPGTVWVSQDDNGNDLADDTWYELKGSLFEMPAERRRYAITYIYALAEASFCQFRDSLGNTGTAVGRFPGYSTSDITFVGTLLDINYSDNTLAGYVDTFTNKFDIEDAVQADGRPIHLDYVDFVKIQCAVQQNAGVFGEISTETGVAYDLSMPNPEMLFEGALNGQTMKYAFAFFNRSSYNLTVTLAGQTQLINVGDDYTFFLYTSHAYFDYSGGNVTFFRDIGTVTFLDR